MLLACGNAMNGWNFSALAVGDLGPIGIGFAAIALHVVRFRVPTFTDRVLALVLGALVGLVAGAALGFQFKVSGFGVATLPILGALVGWLRLRQSIPWLLRKEVDPTASGFIVSHESAWRAYREFQARALAAATVATIEPASAPASSEAARQPASAGGEALQRA